MLEADPDAAPDPAQAWDGWRRRGVAQFHQPHHLMARARLVGEAELTGTTERLLSAGAVWVDYLDPSQPTLSDRSPRPDDQRFRSVTGRRPLVEAVFAAAAQQAGVVVRRGVRVAGLIGGAPPIPSVPHVAGVQTVTGERLRAELVRSEGRQQRDPADQAPAKRFVSSRSPRCPTCGRHRPDCPVPSPPRASSAPARPVPSDHPMADGVLHAPPKSSGAERGVCARAARLRRRCGGDDGGQDQPRTWARSSSSGR